MNRSKFRQALRSMRADYITDKDAEEICSLHYKARTPLWFMFGIANGYGEAFFGLIFNSMKYFKIKYSIYGKEHSGIFHDASEDALSERLRREFSLWLIISIDEIPTKP